MNYPLKLIYSNISYAMLRNINNNFFSISFDIVGEDIQLKIILHKKRDIEKRMVDDMIEELSSITETNTILKPIITTDLKAEKLEYIVYEPIYNQ